MSTNGVEAQAAGATASAKATATATSPAPRRADRGSRAVGLRTSDYGFLARYVSPGPRTTVLWRTKSLTATEPVLSWTCVPLHLSAVVHLVPRTVAAA